MRYTVPIREDEESDESLTWVDTAIVSIMAFLVLCYLTIVTASLLWAPAGDTTPTVYPMLSGR